MSTEKANMASIGIERIAASGATFAVRWSRTGRSLMAGSPRREEDATGGVSGTPGLFVIEHKQIEHIKRAEATLRRKKCTRGARRGDGGRTHTPARKKKPAVGRTAGGLRLRGQLKT